MKHKPRQVDLIVPVLSPGLLQHFTSWGNPHPDTPSPSHPLAGDSLYNRYVFRLLLDQYVTQGSVNRRCRPICPDTLANQVCF